MNTIKAKTRANAFAGYWKDPETMTYKEVMVLDHKVTDELLPIKICHRDNNGSWYGILRKVPRKEVYILSRDNPFIYGDWRDKMQVGEGVAAMFKKKPQ